MPGETFEMDMWCDHCGRDTNHKVVSQGHERDSSYDTETCMVCGWYRMGLTGDKQHEPLVFDYVEGDDEDDNDCGVAIPL